VEKRELRKRYLAKMRSMSSAERVDLSKNITARLFADFDFSSFRVAHLFLSIDANNEVDTRPIIDRLRTEFPAIRVVVPRVGGNELETLVYDDATQLKLSEWNVREPVDDRFVATQSIDIVIVPLLAFDRRGYRVGYGKGFYDRFLKTCRDDCLKIGVSFFPPVENIADAHENDVRLDFCLTPSESYKFA